MYYYSILMKNKIIYLDNAATTKISREVLKQMNYFHFEEYGNPSSIHSLGEKARNALETARKKIADELGCKAHEIIFTSGATESNNLAFFGLARAHSQKKKNKIIISSIEHSSVFEICNELRRRGFVIKELPVDKEGLVNLEELKNNLDNKTLMVS